ncbi:unnamed protein product [Musa hybrid cultivar]
MVGVVPGAQIFLDVSSPLSKLQTELPMARRHSLRCFLEIKNGACTAPYASVKPPDDIEMTYEQMLGYNCH